MKNYNFESFNNKKLYQTLSLYIFNQSIQIPFFHPRVSWNNSKYNWAYDPLQIKKEWIIKKSKNDNARYLKQCDACGNVTWFSKQVITSATNDYITVKEYNMLNKKKKLIGMVKYTLIV
jgi:hypothetical protein